MTVENAFQTVRPRSTEKPLQAQRRPGYVMASNGRFMATLEPNKKRSVVLTPPLSKEERLNNEFRAESFRAMGDEAPRRRAEASRRFLSPVFSGV